MKPLPAWFTVTRFLLLSALGLGIYLVLIAGPDFDALTLAVLAFFVLAALLMGWTVVARKKEFDP